MKLHGNARLTPHGRTLMCQRVRRDGWTVSDAAMAAGCSERTCYRWLERFDAGEAVQPVRLLPPEAAHGLQKAGYATDPQYGQKLVRIMQKFS